MSRFWVPEHLGGSGVLATVAAGLYVSWNGPLLIPAATRLQGIFFWDLLVYLIEGMVFLRHRPADADADRARARRPAARLLVATADHRAIVIVARFVWVFPATYLPRWLSPALAPARSVAAVAMAFHARFHRRARRGLARGGARNSVDDGERRAIPASRPDLFVTFGVIIVTLVGQGLMLPAVVAGSASRARRGRAPARAGRRDCGAQRGDPRVAASSGKNRQRAGSEPGNPRIPQRASRSPRAAYSRRSGRRMKAMREGNDLRQELIEAERNFLYELLREGQITDESRRRLERDLDLEEAAILARREGMTPL